MEGEVSAWEEFAALGRVRRFRAGERVVLDGARPGSVMHIRTGRVRIVSTTPEGDEVTLAIRGPGDLVGDHSALLGGRSDAGVVALEPGEASIVAADRYLEVLGRHPSLMLEQMRRLLSRLQASDRRLVELSTLSVPERVKRQLLRFMEDAATEPDIVPLSQEELAAMCGASRGAVAEVLGRMRNAGLVTTRRRQITVLDLDGLAAFQIDQVGAG
jgi:CRP/FNR family transcriptional regulator, cyclic AMP receptor protein